jgi:hypothetical protein
MTSRLVAFTHIKLATINKAKPMYDWFSTKLSERGQKLGPNPRPRKSL